MIRISTELLLNNYEIVLVMSTTHAGASSLIKKWRASDKYLDLTGNRSRKSLILTKDGYCIITAYSVARLESKIIPKINDTENLEEDTI